MITRAALVSAVAVALVAPAAAQTEKSSANAGTLTCTAAPPSRDEQAEAKLSCKFEPLTGPTANFEGMVRQSGNEGVGEGKIVLVWTVLAPQTDITAKMLEGTYVGSLSSGSNAPGDAPSGLVGGVNKSIHLRPLAAPDQSGPALTVSIVELKLTGVPT